MFWYDELSRLVVSQNAEQEAYYRYSYTAYDDLGRITEVGELVGVSASDTMTDFRAKDPVDLALWISSNTKQEITRTVYDAIDPAISIAHFNGARENYRGRVSAVHYCETDVANYTNATFFNYDIHGNVKSLIQDIDLLDPKLMTYDYDLISGNVNQVSYQPGECDQFLQRYMYDADNRITTAETSRTGVDWDTDARYDYYDHGPLSRVELGEHQVQGTDYAYTIQGWLKGVNSATLNKKVDIGQDGMAGTANVNVARDATGFMLRYFTDDYKSIGTPSGGLGWEPEYRGTAYQRADRDLFNGNIQSMITAISPLITGGQIMGPQGYAYDYDQLNRIKGQTVFEGLNANSNTWESASTQATADYTTSYEYDADGNITYLYRNGSSQGTAGLSMDTLNYTYYNSQENNRLEKVDDQATSLYTTDIDGLQQNANYTYDRIGNLVGDVSESLTTTWNVRGKIKRVDKALGQLNFAYGPMGNRVRKHHINNGMQEYTFYVRDASGNVMATYTSEENPEDPNELRWQSAYIYGSSRLGEERIDETMTDLKNLKQAVYTTIDATPFDPTSTDDDAVSYFEYVLQSWHSIRSRGEKYFESTNHLGNVLAVVSDRKISQGGGTVVEENFTSGTAFITSGATMANYQGQLAITSSTNGGGVALSFPTVPCNSYTVTFDVGMGNSSTLAVDLYDGFGVQYPVTAIAYYSSDGTYEFTFTANSTSALFNYYKLGTNPATFYLDNFKVTEKNYYVADIISASDYYPFGSLMPGRAEYGGVGYRYGFNGMEADNEVKGITGSSYTTEFRQYDPRLGRWLSLEPLARKYPEISPYTFSLNNPINLNDPNGDDPCPNNDGDGCNGANKKNKLSADKGGGLFGRRNKTKIKKVTAETLVLIGAGKSTGILKTKKPKSKSTKQRFKEGTITIIGGANEDEGDGGDIFRVVAIDEGRKNRGKETILFEEEFPSAEAGEIQTRKMKFKLKKSQRIKFEVLNTRNKDKSPSAFGGRVIVTPKARKSKRRRRRRRRRR